MIVVSDSGPLIALSKIKHLDILEKFFGEIIIPEAVWIEVVEKGEGSHQMHGHEQSQRKTCSSFTINLITMFWNAGYDDCLGVMRSAQYL